MLTEVVRPEIISGLLPLGTLALGMAYSVAQRDWFKRVFHNKCQASSIGMKHKCGQDIQIHHIEPQAWSYEHLGKTVDEVDRVDNGIPLCGDSHVGTRGTPDCVHPDQLTTLQEFREGDKQAFNKLQDRRLRMAESGVIYWNDQWDENMKRRVRDQIAKYVAKNPMDQFPKKNHRNGNGNHNGNH